MPLSTFLNGRAPGGTLRGLQFLALSDFAAIERRTAASDDGGGASWAWNVVGTAACRVYPAAGGAGGLVGSALNENTTHFCRLPAGTDVSTPDRIVIANRGTFEVTMVQDRTAEMSTL